MSDELVPLPGVTTRRPDEWFLVRPDGSVLVGSEGGWTTAGNPRRQLDATLLAADVTSVSS